MSLHRWLAPGRPNLRERGGLGGRVHLRPKLWRWGQLPGQCDHFSWGREANGDKEYPWVAQLSQFKKCPCHDVDDVGSLERIWAVSRVMFPIPDSAKPSAKPTMLGFGIHTRDHQTSRPPPAESSHEVQEQRLDCYGQWWAKHQRLAVLHHHRQGATMGTLWGPYGISSSDLRPGRALELQVGGLWRGDQKWVTHGYPLVRKSLLNALDA